MSGNWEPLSGELALNLLSGDGEAKNDGIVSFKLNQILDEQLTSMAKKRRTGGTSSIGIQIEFEKPKARESNSRGYFTLGDVAYPISFDQLTQVEVDESRNGRGVLVNLVRETRSGQTLGTAGLVMGKVKVTGIAEGNERRMGSTLKKLTKKVGDGKTHARVVSDQRPKVGGRGGKGAAGPSSAAAAARMGRSPKVPGNSSSSGNSGSGSGSGGVGSSRKSGLNNSTNSTRITPPKAGRLSAVNNGGSAGGRSPGAGVSRPILSSIRSVKIASRKQLEEQIRLYQDGSRDQKERKKDIEAITAPFAKLGEELERAAGDNDKVEAIEKRIMALYDTGRKERDNKFNHLKKEYSDHYKKLIILKQNVDGYFKKHRGSKPDL